MNIQVDLDKKIVDFINTNSNKVVNFEELINVVIKNLLIGQNINIDTVSVSIQSVSKAEIQEINNEYRGIDKYTDVLSFPIFTYEEINKMKMEIDEYKKVKEIELGDILLCLDVIKMQSVEFDTGIIRETLYMITHGLCHLVGYDHIIEEEKKVMRELEEKIISSLGVF